MGDNATCIKCKQKQNKREKFYVFACDSCNTYYCGDCSELSTSEVRCMPLQERKLKFFCMQCRENDLIECLKNTIVDKTTIINDKQMIIDMLQEQIKKLESTKSYASVASLPALPPQPSRPHTPKNVPPVLVKPKNKQDAEVTKTDLQSKINPSQLNVSIKSVKTSKNGVVIINCNSEQESQKLLQTIQEQDTEDKYTVQLPQMKRPRFKTVISSTNMSMEDLTKCLRQQNPFIQDEDYINLTYIKPINNNKSVLFGECSGDLFGRLMAYKKVFISWERCPIYEDTRIRRCKKCFAYDHKEIDCKNKITCTYCSLEHKSENCPKTFKRCCNCTRANEKFNLNQNAEHEAFSLVCPTYKYFLQRYKTSIDYYSKQ